MADKEALYQKALDAADRMFALEGTGGANFKEAITDFMSNIGRLERYAPELMTQFEADNARAAVAYYGSMATGRYNVDMDPDKKYYNSQAQRVAYDISQDLGFGEDGKMDGKAVVSGYGDQWNDMNNESGFGDFFKFGKPGAVKGGVMDFIEDNPLQVLGIAASAAMPWIAPAVAGALGITSTTGIAALNGALTFGTGTLSGLDPKDAALAGVLTGGTYFLKNASEVANISNALADKVNTATGLSLEGKDLVSAGLIAVKEDPATGAATLVAGEAMDQFWGANPDMYESMKNTGWNPDAITSASLKVAKGGDWQDALKEWVTEGGVGDINLPDFGGLEGGSMDIFGDWDLGQYVDPAVDWVKDFDWGAIKDYTDPLEKAGQAVYDAARDATDPIEALTWPDLPFENPLPNIDIPTPDINLPSLPDAPNVDVGGLLDGVGSLAVPALLAFQDNKNKDQWNQGGVYDVNVPPQDMSTKYVKPQYGAVEQKPLLPPHQSGPIYDVLDLARKREEEKGAGLI